jgi:hypothetical protein
VPFLFFQLDLRQKCPIPAVLSELGKWMPPSFDLKANTFLCTAVTAHVSVVSMPMFAAAGA